MRLRLNRIIILLIGSGYLFGSFPLIAQEILIVETPTYASMKASAENLPIHQRFLTRYVDDSRIMRYMMEDGGEAVCLTEDFASACDPSVSFDGEWILFAGKEKREDRWQIWRMRIDGTDKKQIIQRESDCISPLWVGSLFHLDDDAPTNQIVFVSTESQESGNPQNLYSLYACDTEGNNISRITHNLYNEYDPDALPNGRIVFTSWRECGDSLRSSLMVVSNDGTDLLPFYGNFEEPAMKESVSISFGDRVYFIEANDMNPLGGGDISFVSMRRPLKTYQKLSHDSQGWYLSPRSLPDGGLLASYRSIEADSCYSIYRISVDTGMRERLIYRNPGWHCVDTQVVAQRSPVRGRSTVVDPQGKTGVFYCIDVYQSDRAEMKEVLKGSIQSVRVLEGVIGETEVVSRELGLAFVEEDGSFQIEVPADRPVRFELLNEREEVILSQKTWTWVRPRESRGCIGCHENRELSPPNRLIEAIKKPAQFLLPKDVEDHGIAPGKTVD